MKVLTFLLLYFITISCQQNKSSQIPRAITMISDTPAVKTSPVDTKTTSQINTGHWINSLREFRDAIYHNDKEKAKQFIDFPIMNENNEIWYLVFGNEEEQISKIPETIKPFTAQDFDRYFTKLFPKPFINTLLKLKTEDLYKKGDVESKEWKAGTSTYKMFGTIDKMQNTLTLNLASETLIKVKDGEMEGNEESNIIYAFEIEKNNRIKFKQVRLAG